MTPGKGRSRQIAILYCCTGQKHSNRWSAGCPGKWTRFRHWGNKVAALWRRCCTSLSCSFHWWSWTQIQSIIILEAPSRLAAGIVEKASCSGPLQQRIGNGNEREEGKTITNEERKQRKAGIKESCGDRWMGYVAVWNKDKRGNWMFIFIQSHFLALKMVLFLPLRLPASGSQRPARWNEHAAGLSEIQARCLNFTDW